MTMINFYANRGGKELNATKKAVLERAKASLRRAGTNAAAKG